MQLFTHFPKTTGSRCGVARLLPRKTSFRTRFPVWTREKKDRSLKWNPNRCVDIATAVAVTFWKRMKKKNPEIVALLKSMVNRKNCTQIYVYSLLKFDPASSRSGGTLPIKAARKSLRFFHPPKKCACGEIAILINPKSFCALHCRINKLS